MNIQEVKAEISAKMGFVVGTLDLQGTPDEVTKVVDLTWQYAWFNTQRVRIVFHEQIVNLLKATPNFNGLALKYERKEATAEREAYHLFVVITPKFTASF